MEAGEVALGGLAVESAPPSYRGRLYPVEVISHCVWLYFRFPLSFREVGELMLERGVVVSYETVRRWCLKFGQAYANGLRRRRPGPGNKWHLDVKFPRGRDRAAGWTHPRRSTAAAAHRCRRAGAPRERRVDRPAGPPGGRSRGDAGQSETGRGGEDQVRPVRVAISSLCRMCWCARSPSSDISPATRVSTTARVGTRLS